MTGTLAINDPERLQDQLADLAERSVAEAVANGATGKTRSCAPWGDRNARIHEGRQERGYFFDG
ncbi:MAG: hypothetical protein HOI95_05100, partial [Chromatiales bacterium]|nr:hypothetical protein [Chromatiales bacterium]